MGTELLRPPGLFSICQTAENKGTKDMRCLLRTTFHKVFSSDGYKFRQHLTGKVVLAIIILTSWTDYRWLSSVFDPFFPPLLCAQDRIIRTADVLYSLQFIVGSLDLRAQNDRRSKNRYQYGMNKQSRLVLINQLLYERMTIPPRSSLALKLFSPSSFFLFYFLLDPVNALRERSYFHSGSSYFCLLFSLCQWGCGSIESDSVSFRYTVRWMKEVFWIWIFYYFDWNDWSRKIYVGTIH